MDDFVSRHALFAVTRWDIARPITDVVETKLLFHAQINHGVAVFGAAYFGRPENFHEIPRLRLGEIIEILSEIHFMEKPRRSRPVGIPPAPNALAIALTANHEAFERGVIEMEGTPRTQDLDGLHENEVGRTRAIAW